MGLLLHTLRHLKTFVPHKHMISAFNMYSLSKMFLKQCLKQFLMQVHISHIISLLYNFVNNIFIVHFINNFTIYSYDAVCKGRDLCPNCSRNFCWMLLDWEGQMLAYDKPIPVACSTYVWFCLWHIWSTEQRGWITLKPTVFVWQTTTHTSLCSFRNVKLVTWPDKVIWFLHDEFQNLLT